MSSISRLNECAGPPVLCYNRLRATSVPTRCLCHVLRQGPKQLWKPCRSRSKPDQRAQHIHRLAQPVAWVRQTKHRQTLRQPSSRHQSPSAGNHRPGSHHCNHQQRGRMVASSCPLLASLSHRHFDGWLEAEVHRGEAADRRLLVWPMGSGSGPRLCGLRGLQ